MKTTLLFAVACASLVIVPAGAAGNVLSPHHNNNDHSINDSNNENQTANSRSGSSSKAGAVSGSKAKANNRNRVNTNVDNESLNVNANVNKGGSARGYNRSDNSNSYDGSYEGSQTAALDASNAYDGEFNGEVNNAINDYHSSLAVAFAGAPNIAGLPAATCQGSSAGASAAGNDGLVGGAVGLVFSNESDQCNLRENIKLAATLLDPQDERARGMIVDAIARLDGFQRFPDVSLAKCERLFKKGKYGKAFKKGCRLPE